MPFVFADDIRCTLSMPSPLFSILPWSGDADWIWMLSITYKPYDVKLPLTLLSESDCPKRNWRKHNVGFNNWTMFPIPTMGNYTKLRPTLYDASVLCMNDGIFTHSLTSETTISVPGTTYDAICR